MRGSVVFPTQGDRYRFGVFEFDPHTQELYKSGRIARVRPQSLTLLTLLLARAGELVSRDDIQHAVWGTGTFVDYEQGVNHCIKELRTALGDSAESPRYIQTLTRRGYRFIAPVERLAVSHAAPAITAPALSPADPPVTYHTADPVAPLATAPTSSTRRRSTGMALALFGLLAAVVAVSMYARQFRAATPVRATSLIVLPFTTVQGDPTLGIGLSNAISSRLAGQQLVPIGATRRGGAVAAGTLALDGEISTSGVNVTLVVRLRDETTGTLLWSDRFTVHTDELFSAEDVIAERVVAALNLRLAAVEQDRLRRRYTSNTAAYQQYLRGRAALVKYTPDGTLAAIQAFEGALERDPRYALARAGLAIASADMYLRFAPPGEVERWGKRAESESRAALDLDPDLAEAHLARAAVARKREFDWNTTMTASRRALVLNPNLDQARFFMAAAYYHLGYMEESLIELAKGRSVRGADLIEPVRIEAVVALFSANFVPARGHFEQVSRQSSQAIGDTYLALAYYYSGNAQRGRTMLEALATHPSASTAMRSGAALASILAAQGEGAAARRRLVGLLARDYRDHHVAYSLGATYAQLGEMDNAVRWLQTAADTGFPCLTWFERDPLLEPIRRRPEFAELHAYVRSRRESSLKLE
jgi:DNA-binding winged helix-turn-helix (wHTH) protein/tetratricopeptide (TPR) repeat protein